MTREPKPLLTGTAAIDELRALQMTADIISATPVDDDSFEEPTVEPAAGAMHSLTPLSEIEKMRLQVPILAINSCLDLRAA